MTMTISGLFVIIDGLAALAAFVGCLRAARRHPSKRYLWLVTKYRSDELETG